MNLQDFKITVILAILFGIFHTSCEHYTYYPPLVFDENEGFQFKKEQAFCKSNPGNEIWSKTFIRDEKGNITEEITFSDGSPNFKTTRTFNSNNQQLTDSIFNFNSGKWQLQNSNKFIYNRNLLSETLKYGADGKNTHKTTYSYQGNELRWEEFWYYSENKWKFQYAHSFDFNNNGKLVKKESYQTEKKDKVYDTFIYTYFNNKLVEEKRIIQGHCETGERMLGYKPCYRTAREIARSHHERWDGTGYPDGLKGESIPLAARITAVADAFDALTSKRPYRKKISTQEAVEYLREQSGTLFDPNMISVFEKVIMESLPNLVILE